MASLSLAHSLDYEQKLLIENQGLDLTNLKGQPPSHDALTSEIGQLSASSDTDVGLGSLNTTLSDNPSDTDALSGLLGNSDSTDLASGLDSLLGNNTEMPNKTETDGLDNLLGDLNADSSQKTNGLEGLDALLDTPAEPEPEAAGNEALAGLDSLLADNKAPEKAPSAPGGLSGLDSFLGGLGGGIEIEEVKIEGLGSKEEAKKETPKPAKKTTSQSIKKEDKKTKKASLDKKSKPEAKKMTPQDSSTQMDIAPLDRKLFVQSGTEFGQLLEQIAQLGGWKLKTGSKFSAISKNKVGLSFQNVPLKFVLKWVSTQTGLQYKLRQETLSI
jgi:hypothetical protein